MFTRGVQCASVVFGKRGNVGKPTRLAGGGFPLGRSFDGSGDRCRHSIIGGTEHAWSTESNSGGRIARVSDCDGGCLPRECGAYTGSRPNGGASEGGISP